MTTTTSDCCASVLGGEITASEAETAATLFKALSDPTRLRIVNLLANAAQPVCVCDITVQVELSQPTVSFHLKKLVSAGLLERDQRGVWAYYSVDREAWRRLAEVFDTKGARR